MFSDVSILPLPPFTLIFSWRIPKTLGRSVFSEVHPCVRLNRIFFGLNKLVTITPPATYEIA
jgi:hypothetical protein